MKLWKEKALQILCFSFWTGWSGLFLSFFLEMIVNPENSFKYLKNLQLNKGQEYKEAVQVKPQHVQLKLRTSKYFFLGYAAF